MLDFLTPIADVRDIADEALAGLTQPQKTLPAKLFYDEEGCRLFGAITALPEYYVTRTELALLRQMAPELRRIAPASAALVEYGASRENKAEILLAQMDRPRAYVPIDVAGPALAAMAERMAGGPVAVHPLVADFLAPLHLPEAVSGLQTMGFFPGSTIGNLDPDMAVRFLEQARATLGHQKGAQGAMFLVGVDLRKDAAVLVPAYDDAAGVTAAFNRNLLVRLNREAGADFDIFAFAHEARWNDAEGRIEMHLVSQMPQTVHVAGQPIRFARGESIHTENSYKHTVSGFQALAARAGWQGQRVWADADNLFSVHLLRAA